MKTASCDNGKVEFGSEQTAVQLYMFDPESEKNMKILHLTAEQQCFAFTVDIVAVRLLHTSKDKKMADPFIMYTFIT